MNRENTELVEKWNKLVIVSQATDPKILFKLPVGGTATALNLHCLANCKVPKNISQAERWQQGYVDDTIVNCYMSMLHERGRMFMIKGGDDVGKKKVFLCNTLLFTKAKDNGASMVNNYFSANDGFGDADLILFPANFTKYHWVLIVAETDSGKLHYLDPKKNVTNATKKAKFLQVAASILRRQAKIRTVVMKFSCTTNWTNHDMGDPGGMPFLPHQLDGKSCGVAILIYTNWITSGGTNPDQILITKDTPKYRRHIGCTILALVEAKEKDNQFILIDNEMKKRPHPESSSDEDDEPVMKKVKPCVSPSHAPMKRPC
jgi:hypothetical protein